MSLWDLPQRQTLAVRNGLKEVQRIRLAEAIGAENQRRREAAQQAQVEAHDRISAAGGVRALDRATYRKERAAAIARLRHL